MSVADLVLELQTTNDLSRVEEIADELGTAGDRQAIGPILDRLSRGSSREDPDVEDALCGALVRFGVMTSSGNLTFTFVDSSRWAKAEADLIESRRAALPMKYFATV